MPQDLGGGHQCVSCPDGGLLLCGRKTRCLPPLSTRFATEEDEVKFVTPQRKAEWVVDPNAIPLNAYFRRPSPLEKSASLKKRNKALLFNQQLGVVSKGVDMDQRFVSSAEWEARSKAPRRVEIGKAELRKLFGDRVSKSGLPIFDGAATAVEGESEQPAAAEEASEAASTGEEQPPAAETKP